MAKCWTCGSPVQGDKYKCSACRQIESIDELGDRIVNSGEAFANSISTGLEAQSERLDTHFRELSELQQTLFDDLAEKVGEGLSRVSSAIEWGFSDISWKIERQTDVLISIDRTLQTPTQTQANEWRVMAEEAAKRGVLPTAQDLFEKSLSLSPLDFRTYVGLAQLHIKCDRFDAAKDLLERSIPHAPKGSFDSKSLSYRLMAHIHACRADYSTAISLATRSAELSPQYAPALYDVAQYAAQLDRKAVSEKSLARAMRIDPLYWSLAEHETHFDPLRSNIDGVRANLHAEARSATEAAYSKTVSRFVAARGAFSELTGELRSEQERRSAQSWLEQCQTEANRFRSSFQEVGTDTYPSCIKASETIRTTEPFLSRAFAAVAHLQQALAAERRHAAERRALDEKLEREQNAATTKKSLMFVLVVVGIVGVFALGSFWTSAEKQKVEEARIRAASMLTSVEFGHSVTNGNLAGKVSGSLPLFTSPTSVFVFVRYKNGRTGDIIHFSFEDPGHISRDCNVKAKTNGSGSAWCGVTAHGSGEFAVSLTINGTPVGRWKFQVY